MKALKSRTVWLAIIQATTAVIVAVLAEYELIAYIGVFKSFVDILLRAVTTVPLSQK